MKNAVIVICSILFGMSALLCVMLTGGKTNRKAELWNSLPAVVENTADNLLLTKNYSVRGRNGFLADMVSELSFLTDNDCDIMVEVTGADTEKGLLSVRVTLSYIQPDGTEKKTEHEKTVVLNTGITPEDGV